MGIDRMLNPIGVVRSELKSRKNAPRNRFDNAPEAWIEINDDVAEGLAGIGVGDAIILLTWLHETDRSILTVRPPTDLERRQRGVFATRSPDRPNPIGLHPVTVLEIDGNRLKVDALEAIDGTPIVDIKPVLPRTLDS